MDESNQPNTNQHYYGDLVRKFFLAGAIVMAIGLPFIGDYIAFPTIYSVLAILVLSILGGLTSPMKGWVTIVNTGVSLIALIVFETHAVRFYNDQQAFFFVVNQGLALLFLAASYYSIKTWRGTFSN